MTQRFDPVFSILPASQREIWDKLDPAPTLSFVLYGGTAVALQLGHRQSVDFDFFRTEPLDKNQLRSTFEFIKGAAVLQDSPETLVILAHMPSGLVKVSFFGGMTIGHINAPLQTQDGKLLVASLEDLMATKLKAILDRAEAKDYRDIAAMISAGVSFSVALSAFKKMFGGEPAQVLRAIGFFEDGDLNTLSELDRGVLKDARDRIGKLPDVSVIKGSLAD